MDDYVRQCALPGCDVPIDDIPGRPARRYCTAAHRAAARQARRASMQPDQQARLSETLPWLREPDPEPALARPVAARADAAPVAPRPASAPPRSLAARLGDALPRRRRAIAVIGAAGILAGGYAVTSSQSTEVAGPTQETPSGETTDGWAARAQVTLTSVDRQLDTIAQTEAAWNAMPEHTTVGTPPPVAELRQRKALLEQRKAALQSQLDSYRALARTRADLELSEQNLEAVEKALQDAPTTGAVSSPDQASALAALQEQRDLRIRQRDAKKLELAGIEGSVEKAARVPLPDDGQQTTAVSEKVLDVIHNGGRTGGLPGTPTPGPRRPEVLAGGREGELGQERQATTTSAPPDPRGPRDETAERRAEPRPAPRGPIGKVVDTVGGVLTGGSGAQPAERPRGPVGKVVDTVGTVLGGGRQADEPAPVQPAAAHEPAAEQPAEQPKGPVGKVVDKVGGAVESLVGGKDESSAPSERKKVSPPKDSTAEASQPQVRSTPAAAPAASAEDLAAAVPATELAMAIVRSVPGAEAAAPAVEAAMRQAVAQYAESASASQEAQKSTGGSAQPKSSHSSSGETSSSSRAVPSHTTTSSSDSSSSRSSDTSSGSGSSGSHSSGSDSSGSHSSTSGSSGSDWSDAGSSGSRSSGSSGSDSSGSDSSGWDSSGSDSSGSEKSGSGSSGSDRSSSDSSGSGSGSWSDSSGSDGWTDQSSSSDWSH